MLLLCEEENDPTLIPEAEAAVNEVAKAVEGMQVVKTILVKNRLVNLIVKPQK